MYNCYFIAHPYIFLHPTATDSIFLYDQLSAYNPSRLLYFIFPLLLFVRTPGLKLLFRLSVLLVLFPLIGLLCQLFNLFSTPRSSFAPITLHRSISFIILFSTWHLFLCSPNLYMFLDALQISTSLVFHFLVIPLASARKFFVHITPKA